MLSNTSYGLHIIQQRAHFFGLAFTIDTCLAQTMQRCSNHNGLARIAFYQAYK